MVVQASDVVAKIVDLTNSAWDNAITKKAQQDIVDLQCLMVAASALQKSSTTLPPSTQAPPSSLTVGPHQYLDDEKKEENQKVVSPELKPTKQQRRRLSLPLIPLHLDDRDEDETLGSNHRKRDPDTSSLFADAEILSPEHVSAIVDCVIGGVDTNTILGRRPTPAYKKLRTN